LVNTLFAVILFIIEELEHNILLVVIVLELKLQLLLVWITSVDKLLVAIFTLFIELFKIKLSVIMLSDIK